MKLKDMENKEKLEYKASILIDTNKNPKLTILGPVESAIMIVLFGLSWLFGIKLLENSANRLDANVIYLTAFGIFTTAFIMCISYYYYKYKKLRDKMIDGNIKVDIINGDCIAHFWNDETNIMFEINKLDKLGEDGVIGALAFIINNKTTITKDGKPLKCGLGFYTTDSKLKNFLVENEFLQLINID